MSRSLRARIELLLTGNVSRQSRKFGRDMTQMGDRGELAMGRLERRAASAGAGMGRLVGRATALAGAYLGMAALGREISLDEKFERLGIAAGKSKEEMKALRAELTATAEAKDVQIDPSQIFDAIALFTEATGDFEFGRSMQREMALTIQATGQAGAEIGKLMASIKQKFNIDTPEEMLRVMDALAIQGKEGAVELGNLAGVLPEVAAAWGAIGEKGEVGIRKLGAMLQILKRNAGSIETTRTLATNLLGQLANGETQDKLTKLGVNLNDAEGNLVGPLEMLQRIIIAAEASGKDIDKQIGTVFRDKEVMNGIRAFIEMYKNSGNFDELDALIDVKADGTTLKSDSGRIAETASAKLESSTANLSAVAGEVLAPAVQQLADALNGFDRETIRDLATSAAALAAAYVGVKAIKGGVGLASDIRAAMGPRRVGASVGGALGQAASLAKPMPVFVTNPGFGKGVGGKAAARGGIGGNAASAAQIRAETDRMMNRAMVDEAAKNSGRRAKSGAGMGAFTALGAIVNAQSDMDDIFARRDALMAGGMTKDEAFGKARDEKADENNEAFKSWLERNSFGLYSASEEPPEPAPDADGKYQRHLQLIAANRAMFPDNPVKKDALAPFQSLAGGETSIVQRLTSTTPQTDGPQSTAAALESSQRLIGAMEDVRDEIRDQTDETRQLRRDLKRNSRFTPSAPGETFEIGAAP